MTRDDREFSIVVFGATGDAGRAVCRYLATKQGARPVKWAVAGRSKAKLETLVSSLGGSSAPSVLLADACDASSLLRIAERATLVFSAVGPYSRLGEPMVKACLVARTHWADITGEVFWVGEMEAKHGEAAAAAGVTLTSLCGYDSVPCELSLHVARKALKLGARHSELLDAEAVTQLNVPEAPRRPASPPPSFPPLPLHPTGVDRGLPLRRASASPHRGRANSERSPAGGACPRGGEAHPAVVSPTCDPHTPPRRPASSLPPLPTAASAPSTPPSPRSRPFRRVAAPPPARC